MTNSMTNQTVSDAAQLCQNWRRHYESHIRANQNEWLIEEMESWVDDLNIAAYQAYKHGVICKEKYQDIVAIAWEHVGILRKNIRIYEEQEDYVERLCPSK